MCDVTTIDFKTRVRGGLPCQVKATLWGGYDATDVEPGSDDEWEITVYDRRGRRAVWLEKRLSDDEWSSLEEQAVRELKNYGEQW